MTINRNLSILAEGANSSGVLGTANGGTNSTATPTAGGVVYGNGTAYAFTSAGTTGQFLQSNGSSAPSWATPSSGLTYYTAYGSNQNITNPSTYITAVSVSNGITGTWFACGTVTVVSSSGEEFYLKLWDGTTLISSTTFWASGGNNPYSGSVSGIITNPAGNIRISVTNSNGDGSVKGTYVNGNATTLSAIKIA